MLQLKNLLSAPALLILLQLVNGRALAQPGQALPSQPADAPATAGSGPVPQVPSSTAPEPARPPTLSAAPGKGVTVSSADGDYSMMIRPRMQLRGTVQKDDAGSQFELQVRTVRLVISGNAVLPELKYYLQFAFGGGDFDGNASPVFDAFVEYSKWRDLNVRVGQFFVPFDRARTIREFALQFVDRQGVVRELTLDRDVGVMISSQDLFGLGGRLAYHLFMGGGDGRNRFADNTNKYGPQDPGALFVARLVARPFGQFDDDMEGDLSRSKTPKLAIGVAGAYNISSSRDKSTYGPTYTLGTFNYAHAAVDLVFKWHGFSFLTEFLYRGANKESHTRLVDGEVRSELSRSGYGYFAQVGQMLIDKLEITARAEVLKGKGEALRELARKSGRQLGAGLNYYLNGHALKLQADSFYVFGDDVGRGAHIARIQIDGSF